MTEHPNLPAALAAFQAELPRVGKDRKANVGQYGYDYAGLEDINPVVMPLLGKHGLSFVAKPTLTPDGQFVLAFSLLHASGDREDGTYPLPAGGKPQEIGSAITYARRYALCAVTGLAPGGEDDDGKAAQDAAKPEPARAEAKKAPAKAAGGGGETWRSDLQRRRVGAVHAHFKRLGFTDDERDYRLVTAVKLAGIPGPIESLNDLGMAQLATVADALGKCRDRDALVALLAEGASA